MAVRNNGIDYGLGQTNIDKSNGVRYGIIQANKVDSWFWEEVETIYPDYECEEPDCECGDDPCECEHSDGWCDFLEPIEHIYDQDGLQFRVDSDGFDIWVFKSPYVTMGKFCSPCAPGAVSLGTNGDILAYCLPEDWFDDLSPCPYVAIKLEEALDAREGCDNGQV